LMKLPDHKTKIVCTIGPASATQEVMEQMLLAGMNVARLNFSHGALDSHRKVISNLRAAARATGKRLAIMADLSGRRCVSVRSRGTGGAAAGRCAGADGR